MDSIIGKALNKDGFLRVAQVEKLLDAEVKLRETDLKSTMSAAKDAARRGDKEAAIAQYRAVLDRKCLVPKQAKDVRTRYDAALLHVPVRAR